MKTNPCRYCALAIEHKGRHYRNRFKEECWQCENWKRHEEYLKSQRIFLQGEQIRRMDVLLKQEWIMWGGTPKHIKIIKNLQFGTVLFLLKNGRFYKTIRKESEEK